MKRIICFALCAALMLISSQTSFAYEFPHAFWAPNDRYVEALANKDYRGVIENGLECVEIMENEPDTPEKRNVVIMRLRETGLAYEALGDYDSSAQIFERLYNYTVGLGDSIYFDDVKVAKAKMDSFPSALTMYTDEGGWTYYGAKNEPQNGVLYGIPADSVTREELSNESMILLYHEIGDNVSDYNRYIMRVANECGCHVEYALNCRNLWSDIHNIYNYTDSLQQLSDLFSENPNVPVLLRFAAEFNIWGNEPDAQVFVNAFRYVSKFFKERNQNVAIVWSPNQVSNWYFDLDSYYPGDEYVDWVGMSSYATRYFIGDKNQPETNELVFKTGHSSNPVIAVKDIVEKYGDRKPIMISESGSSHYVYSTGENMHDFAMTRIRQYYSYLPMVYPQIKLIAHFDNYINGEINDYRLLNNSELKAEYLKLTKGARFIQKPYSNNVNFAYRKIENGTSVNDIFVVSSYAHMYKEDISKVAYYIDGNYVGESDRIPFTVHIDANEYPGGHTLKAVAQSQGGKTVETEAWVNIGYRDSKPILVTISGDDVEFDREPALYNDRTMVPMRKIFETLGASVGWDGATQTATGRKGDLEIKFTLESNVMTINGEARIIDTPPIVLSGRTLVPVRAVAESLGCIVDWDGENNRVIIEQ